MENKSARQRPCVRNPFHPLSTSSSAYRPGAAGRTTETIEGEVRQRPFPLPHPPCRNGNTTNAARETRATRKTDAWAVCACPNPPTRRATIPPDLPGNRGGRPGQAVGQQGIMAGGKYDPARKGRREVLTGTDMVDLLIPYAGTKQAIIDRIEKLSAMTTRKMRTAPIPATR